MTASRSRRRRGCPPGAAVQASAVDLRPGRLGRRGIPYCDSNTPSPECAIRATPRSSYPASGEFRTRAGLECPRLAGVGQPPAHADRTVRRPPRFGTAGAAIGRAPAGVAVATGGSAPSHGPGGQRFGCGPEIASTRPGRVSCRVTCRRGPHLKRCRGDRPRPTLHQLSLRRSIGDTLDLSDRSLPVVRPDHSPPRRRPLLPPRTCTWGSREHARAGTG